MSEWNVSVHFFGYLGVKYLTMPIKATSVDNVNADIKSSFSIFQSSIRADPLVNDGCHF